MAPRSEILLAAYKEARVLADCTRRTERAIHASQLPTFNGVGDEDIVGIPRGACMKKGCDCTAYIQKHGRTTVLLQGKGHVRQDNDPAFFMCRRCGHDCTSHKDLRDVVKAQSTKPGARGGGGANWAPPSSYTNAGGGGARGGLDSSYYYAHHAAQAAAGEPSAAERGPVRIDPSTVGSGLPALPPSSRAPADAGGTEFDVKSASGVHGYYYAHHGRKTDYKVPTVPQKLNADGSTTAWQPPTSAATGSSGYSSSSYVAATSDRDEWEADCDPSLLVEADPLAIAGDAKGTAAAAELDPLAVAFGGGAGGTPGSTDDGLLAADPFACNACKD